MNIDELRAERDKAQREEQLALWLNEKAVESLVDAELAISRLTKERDQLKADLDAWIHRDVRDSMSRAT